MECLEACLYYIRLLEKLAKLKLRGYRKTQTLSFLNYLCNESASTTINLEARVNAMETSISRVDVIPETFAAPHVFGGEHLLLLAKEIDQRREALKKQIQIQRSLIKFERKRFKKLARSLENVHKQRDKMRDKYLSILNTDGFRNFLTINLVAAFED